jgi:hypothetical protein
MIWQDVNVVLEEEVLNNARNVGVLHCPALPTVDYVGSDTSST